MPHTLPITQIDAFTTRPFTGNPAAVCILPQPQRDDFLQSVASEMNLSETAFLSRRDDGDWDLRWFTPLTEVELCGHATLASAHHLWEDGHVGAGEAMRFHTLSGPLTARRGADGWIEMDFPALPAKKMGALPGLAEALGETPVWVGGNGTDLLVELASETIVRQRCPDLSALRRLPARGIIVTAVADPAGQGNGGTDGNGHRRTAEPYDFVSRFFAPAVGVDEDPVTGSAHCCLGPFWAQRLGRDELVGYQASRRGGVVRVHPAGERVTLGGQAVTVMRGELQAG
jgi:predicted PhzF superfamily epimerase YddE/YHI9